MREFNEIDFSKNTKKEIKRSLYAAYLNKDRVRITYKKGFEDFSGYHDKTGLIHTCFIGMSTGTKPILLEIHNIKSNGGGGLLTDCIRKVETLKKIERRV